MNRETYLKELNKYLKRLPQKDYENAVAYFEEYFADAGAENEERVIRELGTPKEAAAEILRDLLDESAEMLEKEGAKKRSVGKNIRLAVLAVLAAPVGVPLIVAAVALIISLAAVVASVIICAFTLSLSLFCIGGKLLLRGFVAMPVSLSGALFLCGLGLLAVGCSILSVILAVYVTRWCSALTVRFAKRMIRKRGK